MSLRPTIRLRFAWFALCAVLLGAFAPSAAYALAASRPALPVDVCTTHGGPAFAAAVALLSQDQDARSAHGAASGHCSDCLSHHGHAPGLPDAAPPAVFRFVAPGARHEPPRTASASAHPGAARVHALPRGPPAFA